MDKQCRSGIGKKITVKFKFQVDGKTRYEYIQGVLEDIVDDFLIISQRIPFYNFLVGEKSEKIERKIHLSNIEGNSETFD